jgi:hypothetical protein
VFLNSAIGATPEESPLLQMQGMVAEYERAEVAVRERVTNIVGEISSASKEQASGIERVNIAVTKMAEVTRAKRGIDCGTCPFRTSEWASRDSCNVQAWRRVGG